MVRTKDIIAIMLTGMICIVVIGALIGNMLLANKGMPVNSQFGEKMFDLAGYILGVISGYILTKQGDKDKK